MIQVARPLPTKLAAAVVAAGVVSAGAVVDLPDPRQQPQTAVATVDVANTSLITGLLLSAGQVVEGLTNGTRTVIDAAVTFPADLIATVAAAAQDPALLPSLISFLAQNYLNPSPTALYSYAEKVKFNALLVAGNIPIVGGTAESLIELVSAWAGLAFDALPNPLPGLEAVWAFRSTDLGKLIYAARAVPVAPVWAISNVIDYLGYLPADLEAAAEAALWNPLSIPGLASWLAWRLLGSGGLQGTVVWNLGYPLFALPVVGDFFESVYWDIENAIDSVLGLLPEPRSPYLVNGTIAGQVEEAEPNEAAGLAAPDAEDPADTGGADTESDGAATPVGENDNTAEPDVEEVTPPAEDAVTEAVSRRSPLLPKVKAGNKFVPGSAEPGVGTEAGGVDSGSDEGTDPATDPADEAGGAASAESASEDGGEA